MGERATAPGIGPGTILNNTYRIERLLAEGGMGAVWEASHLRVPKRVAVKVLVAGKSADQIARFRQEAEIASRLGHPNIVDVLDFDTACGTSYMVMELLQGESLAARLERGPLDPERTVAIVWQIAAALQAAHDAGVIHRDLKPANVFLVPRVLDGVLTHEVKVLDFGISKVHGSQVVRTGDNTVLGTPQYMAPEQASARHDELDARTDQFALAAIAYEMLAGRPAFDGDNATQIMFKIVHESPPPLESRVVGVPMPIARAVTRALSTRPIDRYPDLSSFVQDLSGRPLKPATERMNRPTAPASPVRRDVPVVAEAPARRESRTVAERPQARTPAAAPPSLNRRRALAAVAIAGVTAVATVAVAYVRCDPDPHGVASIAADPGPAVAQISTDAAPAVVQDPPPDAPVASDAAPSPPRPSPPTRIAPPSSSAPPAVVPPEIASKLDLADKLLDAGDLDNADHHARATTMQHEYPRANVILAEVGCARHDLAQAHGFMRRAGGASWPAIRKRCAMLGFPITDPD